MKLLNENFLLMNKKNNLLFKDLIGSWLLYKKHQIKNSTFYRYQYILNKYILEYFKNVKVIYFEKFDFNSFIDNLSLTLSVKTIKDIVIVLKSILRYAEKKYKFDFALDLISTPKYEAEEITILSKSERIKLENFCINKNSFRNIGIIICLNTGIRIGEICALTWNDIDLNNKLITINKSLQRVYKDKNNTKVLIDKPKSKKSIRKIPINRKLYKILAEIKLKNSYSGDEFFLTGKSDKYVEPRNYQYMLKKCFRECNIKNYKFHILRHTFATECIEIGMDIKSLSEILGHASVNVTLNKYVHSSFYTKKKFLEKL